MSKGDCIRIDGLSVDTCIGVYDWEQTVPQTLKIDLQLHYSMPKAATNDDLEAAVDYAALAARVSEHTRSSRLQLIETLATQLAELILAEFPLHSCHVTVHKPLAIEAADDVSVTIYRTNPNKQPVPAR